MGAYQYGNVPVIRHSRSRFDLSHKLATSANVGSLVPFYLQEVYPADTFKVNTAVVSRLATSFVKPVMDNLFLEMWYFYVPSRLLYDKFVNIFGENPDGAWASDVEYSVPQTSGTVSEKTVGDYLGLPLGSVDSVSILPFRAFAKIYDEWFRDENVITPMLVQTGVKKNSETLNNNAWSPSNYTGKLPKVAKFHDYFTSCLPSPQKGTSIDIPLTLNNGRLPVVPMSDFVDLSNSDMVYPVTYVTDPVTGAGFSSGQHYSLDASYLDSSTSSSIPVSGVPSSASMQNARPLSFDNLWAVADGSTVDSGMTVNDLRFAFAYQKLLEKSARGGSRYIEYLAQNFNVYGGDGRLQRSEFLGGKRIPISITQVTQTTGYSDDESSQTLGQMGAFSLSGGMSRICKSFTEHGFIIGVFAIRQFHSYQQGVDRFWTRKRRTDFYDPTFANIGEQPVYDFELFGAGENRIAQPVVFGYNEAWADLRRSPNKITGQMRSTATDSYDVWHFADVYENAPVLGQTFIEETPDFVDRTITAESTATDQFILDFYLNVSAVRELPTYSVPSLIDHG